MAEPLAESHFHVCLILIFISLAQCARIICGMFEQFVLQICIAAQCCFLWIPLGKRRQQLLLQTSWQDSEMNQCTRYLCPDNVTCDSQREKRTIEIARIIFAFVCSLLTVLHHHQFPSYLCMSLQQYKLLKAFSQATQ